MWFKWLPWKAMIRYAARREGFLDPFSVLAGVSRFARPSEVFVPVELLRSSFILHARGLINSQAIQHNLDWVWPYWVVKQFDPLDRSFIPRAFSLTHINLTHRNWTAVGVPGCEELPIIDPRGLITPVYDGWSIDFWILADKDHLLPSRTSDTVQSLGMSGNIDVYTGSTKDGMSIESRTCVIRKNGRSFCRVGIAAVSDKPAWLVISVRPYNPEGISFINKIRLLPNRRGWKVNRRDDIWITPRPLHYKFSHYSEGDVYQNIMSRPEEEKVSCNIGMCTAAGLYALYPGKTKKAVIYVPLESKKKKNRGKRGETAEKEWNSSIQGQVKVMISEEKIMSLHDAAIRTLIVHSPREAYAGPYTYKRFWFRDAVFMTYALLCAGLTEKAERIIDTFFIHQRSNGYFCSQNGEWDSNGQVLWVIDKFCQLTGKQPEKKWVKAVEHGAAWICSKIDRSASGTPHEGLLPAGFSAEHLGPSDYYYWDDFWSAAGLRAASSLIKAAGNNDRAGFFYRKAAGLVSSVEKSLKRAEERLGCSAMPASPYRRLDSGCVGSLAAGYPLQLFAADDERLAATAEYLLKNCIVGGGFFHDMSHSGINPYLTLHIAQVLLRKGDQRFFSLMETVKNIASSTGQWPEAVHPATGGGCMGDGQHVWAAAEWMIMVRNCFLREEEEKLVICPGIIRLWRDKSRIISYGPAPTVFGTVSVSLECDSGKTQVYWHGDWRSKVPVIEIGLPGFAPVIPEGKDYYEFKEGI